MVAELPSDGPVSVGTKAITPAKPNSKNKPGEGGKQKHDQVPFPELGENPTQGIKKDQ